MPAAERQRYIEELRAFPDVLEARVSAFSDAELDARPIEGEWSIRQNVHHLADSHMSANFRFRLPLDEDNPVVPTYDQDAWARHPDYALPLAPSLMILRGLHMRFVALLEGLTPEQWSRPVSHPSWGMVDVEEIARLYSGHCAAHLAQIAAVAARL
jgi:hypothetical protein